MRVLAVPFGLKKRFLGLAKASYVDILEEQIQDLQNEIYALKEYLNIDDSKKFVPKKTVADDVLETISKFAPALSGIIEQSKKQTKK